MLALAPLWGASHDSATSAPYLLVQSLWFLLSLSRKHVLCLVLLPTARPYLYHIVEAVVRYKPETECGLYAHPEICRQSDSKQIGKRDLPQLLSTPEEQRTQP